MKHGLWYSVGGDPLATSVELSIERDNQFTTTIIAREIRPRASELAVVSLTSSSADYFAISQLGRQVATGQVTVAFSNLVSLGGVTGKTIREALPSRFRSGFAPPSKGPWRPSPRLWEEIIQVLLDQRPGVHTPLVELRHIVSSLQLPRTRHEGGLETLERDAVASALQTWRGDSFRKRVLRSARVATSAPTASFLSHLQDSVIREDLQITHDHITFPGMFAARKHAVGSVVLSDAHGEEFLTILNCNRQPLEETLGVDLIYYNHTFDSFVLVQYKRMTGEAGKPVSYRPVSDPNHDRELERMLNAARALKALSGGEAKTLNAFRLSEQAFYMKLCEAKTRGPLDAGMIPGLYIPLDLWVPQLGSVETKGPRGGVVMGWDTCHRRFNNGEFTNLLRHGWIGSAPGQSRFLETIIETVLESGRMLVLAATSAGPLSQNYRRDGLGRFSAEDDPAGAF